MRKHYHKDLTKNAPFIIGIFILIISGFHLTNAQEKTDVKDSQKNDPVQPKFALLVGIKKYKSDKLPEIDGCKNNVSLLGDTLIKDYGFEEKNVLTLTDEKAGKEAIINNFRFHLIENAKKAKEQGKEAVIVYYFCGHGSQYKDQDMDENDGKDETFVAFDSRTGDAFDILDDELDDLKAELRAFTTNTTLILESCHSGTGSRGDFRDEQYISEEADEDTRERKPYKRKFPPTTDAEALTYTEIAASLSTNTAKSESAQFCNCEKPMSLMTKALIEGLKRATYNTTYRGLVREVSGEVSTRSRQEPQVEGNRDAIIFGGEAKRAKPYIEIEKILLNDQMIIKAGSVHGLKEGSQISVYSSESVTNTGKDDWLTNGIVNQVGNFSSVVNIPALEENPKVKDIKLSSHVVLASPIFGGGSVLLALDPNNARSLQNGENTLSQKIEDKLKTEGLFDSQLLKIVASDKVSIAEQKSDKGMIRLRKGMVKDIFPGQSLISPLMPQTSCDGDNLITNPAEKRFPASDREVYYLDDGESGGIPLFGKTFDPSDKKFLAENIAESIKSYAYQSNLIGLDNKASNLSSQIKVSLQTIPGEAIIEKCVKGDKKYAKNGDKFKGFQDIKNGRISVNSYFQIKIKNISGEVNRKIKKDPDAAGEPFHISVISLTNSGEIKNVYASKGANDALKDEGEINIFLKMTEPVGIERYLIVISKENVDFSFYETKGAKRVSGSILERVLTQSGLKTRDTRSVIDDSPDQWDVIHLDLNIVEKMD